LANARLGGIYQEEQLLVGFVPAHRAREANKRAILAVAHAMLDDRVLLPKRRRSTRTRCELFRPANAEVTCLDFLYQT